MTITIRLPDELEMRVRQRAAAAGEPVSEFVRQAIAEKLTREAPPARSPFELGQHLFGRYSDGDVMGSAERKSRLAEIVRGKHHRR